MSMDNRPMTSLAYGLLLAVSGLLKSWAAPALNNPVFAELVAQDLRPMVYAFDRSAGVLATCFV